MTVLDCILWSCPTLRYGTYGAARCLVPDWAHSNAGAAQTAPTTKHLQGTARRPNSYTNNALFCAVGTMLMHFSCLVSRCAEYLIPDCPSNMHDAPDAKLELKQ